MKWIAAILFAASLEASSQQLQVIQDVTVVMTCNQVTNLQYDSDGKVLIKGIGCIYTDRVFQGTFDK